MKEILKIHCKKKCLNRVRHDTITFDKLFIDIQNQDSNIYNKKLIKLQNFYARYLFKTNQTNNIVTAISI